MVINYVRYDLHDSNDKTSISIQFSIVSDNKIMNEMLKFKSVVTLLKCEVKLRLPDLFVFFDLFLVFGSLDFDRVELLLQILNLFARTNQFLLSLKLTCKAVLSHLIFCKHSAAA
jgi:hypothetical protein